MNLHIQTVLSKKKKTWLWIIYVQISANPFLRKMADGKFETGRDETQSNTQNKGEPKFINGSLNHHNLVLDRWEASWNLFRIVNSVPDLHRWSHLRL